MLRRDGRTESRRASWSGEVLDRLPLRDGVLELRTPRLSDAADWSAARLANREWLERTFPAWGSDWAAEQSEVAWAQRCWHLRRLSAAGRCKPFVMRLDGRLIGEIGIDAVDEISNSGEASVWMVRSHGSATVMNAASLLVIQRAFTGPSPVRRILSPVATTSREGRSPGLSAVGFEIEATWPRRVGASGLLDHDMWVVHNTPANVRLAAAGLAAMLAAAATPAPAPSRSTSDRRRLAGTAGRAAVREARAGLRGVRQELSSRGARGTLDRPLTIAEAPGASLRPTTRGDRDAVGDPRSHMSGATSWSVHHAGRVVATVSHRTDVGTGTTELFVVARPGADRRVLAGAIGSVLDDVRPAAEEPRVLLVRIPLDAPSGTVPDTELLTELGLDRVARYRGNPDGPHRWGGEELWRVPAASR